jgi:hypothetical protein
MVSLCNLFAGHAKETAARYILLEKHGNALNGWFFNTKKYECIPAVFFLIFITILQCSLKGNNFVKFTT